MNIKDLNTFKNLLECQMVATSLTSGTVKSVSKAQAGLGASEILGSKEPHLRR